MLFKIKLENDSRDYEEVIADNADEAIDYWLKNHSNYFFDELILNQFKLLRIDLNGIIYEIELLLNIKAEKID
jgi:hypothetical protein